MTPMTGVMEMSEHGGCRKAGKINSDTEYLPEAGRGELVFRMRIRSASKHFHQPSA